MLSRRTVPRACVWGVFQKKKKNIHAGLQSVRVVFCWRWMWVSTEVRPPTVRVSILFSDATVGCGAVPSCTRLMLAAVTPSGARPETAIEVVALWLYPIYGLPA